jgi:glycosidase
LRHRNAALLDGDNVPRNQDDPNVRAYLRHYKDKAVLVVLNMSAAPQKVGIHLQFKGFPSPNVHALMASGKHKGGLA